jgi:hypothetical protein
LVKPFTADFIQFLNPQQLFKPPQTFQQLITWTGVSFSEERKQMSRGSHPLSSLLLAAALASSLAGFACEHHHYYRVYDPYYTDYHVWNNDEVVYYNRWAGETHRDPHREFRKLPPEEQKEYWTWRHNHGDHDRH